MEQGQAPTAGLVPEHGSSELIQVPAQVTGMNPRQDRSWLLKFETMELSGEQVKILADNLQGEGWLVFRPNGELTVKDIPNSKAESGAKTPSKRLYNTIFVLWKQKNIKADFESFYRTYMERLIESVQEQLEPEDE